MNINMRIDFNLLKIKPNYRYFYFYFVIGFQTVS